MGPAERNLETVRELVEAWLRRDGTISYDAYDDEVTWDARAIQMPEFSEVFRGLDGVRTFWRRWVAAWGLIEPTSEPSYFVHGGQVVACWTQRNHGRGSGVPLDQEAAVVYTFVGGRIVHIALFWSCAEALEALGIDSRSPPRDDVGTAPKEDP